MTDGEIIWYPINSFVNIKAFGTKEAGKMKGSVNLQYSWSDRKWKHQEQENVKHYVHQHTHITWSNGRTNTEKKQVLQGLCEMKKKNLLNMNNGRKIEKR